MIHQDWKTVTSQALYTGNRMSVRRDEIVRPNGTAGAYVYMELLDGVRVVALDEADRIALIEEDVYVSGQRLLMLPGGGCERGEEPERAAARELAEEAGITVDEIQLLTRMWRMPANVRTREHLYLARGLHIGEPRRETSEADMTLHWIPLDEAVAMCVDGAITEAGTLAAILLTSQKVAAPGAPGTVEHRSA